MRTRRYFQALLFLAAVVVATPACAEQVYGNGGARRPAYDYERRAYDNGYREGVQDGQDDARRGRDFSYQRPAKQYKSHSQVKLMEFEEALEKK